ncbi:MAG: hypothetical protein JJLCMIEE_00685 [Acidimicrobiales bacterium]|nr:hypothetical protein [Acidimicrobiales bacterium]
MRYLTEAEVQEIHEREVGSGGLADYALLASAVGRPRATAFGEDAYLSIHDKRSTIGCGS